MFVSTVRLNKNALRVYGGKVTGLQTVLTSKRIGKIDAPMKEKQKIN